MKMEAETEMMQPQVKEDLPPDSGRGRKNLEPSEGAQPRGHLGWTSSLQN